MKLYTRPKYTEIVRVEIKLIKSGKMRSISFCQTNIEEVLCHVKTRLKTSTTGIKVRITIRISDKEKAWGKLKSFTTFIRNTDKAVQDIIKGVEIQESSSTSTALMQPKNKLYNNSMHTCKSCGSSDVLLHAWINPNDNNSFIQKVDDTFDGWCYSCSDVVLLNEKES